MPRIKPEHERCIFFLFRADEAEPEGTGFFVRRCEKIYAVSNHHVAITGMADRIRINDSGGSRVIETEPDQWKFSPENDLASLDVTDLLLASDQIFPIDDSELVTEEFGRASELGLGDEVFMIGLFAERGGSQRNIPSARFGSISQMPSKSAKISVRHYPPKAAFLTDMRSRGGYSGSPVFAFRTAFYDLRNFAGPDYVVGLGDCSQVDNHSSFLRLLGVHCASYPETIRLSSDGKPTVEGRIESHSSIGVVIPAWSIISLLS